jgi:hypothetical protein
MPDGCQQAVAGRVAVGVVVGLEPVDVEQDERHAAAIAAHPGELAAQHLGEVVVVAQAREADRRGREPCGDAERGSADAEELTGAARTSPHGGNLATAADGVEAGRPGREAG